MGLSSLVQAVFSALSTAKNNSNADRVKAQTRHENHRCMHRLSNTEKQAEAIGLTGNIELAEEVTALLLVVAFWMYLEDYHPCSWDEPCPSKKMSARGTKVTPRHCANVLIILNRPIERLDHLLRLVLLSPFQRAPLPASSHGTSDQSNGSDETDSSTHLGYYIICADGGANQLRTATNALVGMLSPGCCTQTLQTSPLSTFSSSSPLPHCFPSDGVDVSSANASALRQASRGEWRKENEGKGDDQRDGQRQNTVLPSSRQSCDPHGYRCRLVVRRFYELFAADGSRTRRNSGGTEESEASFFCRFLLLLRRRLRPHLIVGDLDSVSSETLAYYAAIASPASCCDIESSKGVSCHQHPLGEAAVLPASPGPDSRDHPHYPIIKRVRCQDSTDMMKAYLEARHYLDAALRSCHMCRHRQHRHHNRIIFYGAFGGRLDHTLHSLHWLAQCYHQKQDDFSATDAMASGPLTTTEEVLMMDAHSTCIYLPASVAAYAAFHSDGSSLPHDHELFRFFASSSTTTATIAAPCSQKTTTFSSTDRAAPPSSIPPFVTHHCVIPSLVHTVSPSRLPTKSKSHRSSEDESYTDASVEEVDVMRSPAALLSLMQYCLHQLLDGWEAADGCGLVPLTQTMQGCPQEGCRLATSGLKWNMGSLSLIEGEETPLHHNLVQHNKIHHHNTTATTHQQSTIPQHADIATRIEYELSDPLSFGHTLISTSNCVLFPDNIIDCVDTTADATPTAMTDAMTAVESPPLLPAAVHVCHTAPIYWMTATAPFIPMAWKNVNNDKSDSDVNNFGGDGALATDDAHKDVPPNAQDHLRPVQTPDNSVWKGDRPIVIEANRTQTRKFDKHPEHSKRAPIRKKRMNPMSMLMMNVLQEQNDDKTIPSHEIVVADPNNNLTRKKDVSTYEGDPDNTTHHCRRNDLLITNTPIAAHHTYRSPSPNIHVLADGRRHYREESMLTTTPTKHNASPTFEHYFETLTPVHPPKLQNSTPQHVQCSGIPLRAMALPDSPASPAGPTCLPRRSCDGQKTVVSRETAVEEAVVTVGNDIWAATTADIHHYESGAHGADHQHHHDHHRHHHQSQNEPF